MITYVDTSALLKLLVEESGSRTTATIWDDADELASAGLVVVEARAALAAAERGRRLSSADHREAKDALELLMSQIHLIAVTDHLLGASAELAEEQALRGFDAVHLGAALHVGAALMASADTDLCEAASRSGLHVINPLDG